MSNIRHLSVTDPIVIAGSFPTEVELKIIDTSDNINYPNLSRAFVDSLGEYYLDLNDNSSTEDLPNIIEPNGGIGRWILLEDSTITPNNLIKLLGNAGGGVSATGSTTDNTPLSVAVIDFEAEDCFMIKGNFIAKNDWNQTIGGNFYGVFKTNSSNNTSQIGPTDLNFKTDSGLMTPITFTIDNTAKTVSLNVVGESGPIYDWLVKYELIKI